MNPHEALSLATKLAGLFDGISAAEGELLQTMLEKFPYALSDAVISRYAQETATFDRGRLRTLLREEHSRRTHRESQTPGWMAAKDTEARAIEDALNRIPKKHLKKLVEDVRQKRPDLFRLLRSDPLVTDIGRSLIYDEFKNQQCT